MPNTRRLRVRHRTSYQYDQPVDHSRHLARLRPIHDRRQSLISHAVRVESQPADAASAVSPVEFEDAFGNDSARFSVDRPYTSLDVIAESVVEIEDHNPFAYAPNWQRPKIPLNWMPRERLALSQYLQSEELPDTQLEELFEYVMGVVQDNDGDLLETLFAINLTLFKGYEYVPGSTSVATTPYEVFSTKKGVCQDFSGLFITFARLLRVPARYVCGYLYTGNSEKKDEPSASRAPSDATHAWVQLYLPNLGWKGFDPTNGVLPRLDHVRLGYGRFWRDTAPIQGTLYGERVKESLDVAVEVLDETDQ